MHTTKLLLGGSLFIVAMTLAGCAPSIHDVAAMGDPETLKTMLDSDPDLLLSTNELGKTPLHFAASHGRLDSLRTLAEYDVDWNVQDDTGMTALHICAGRDMRPLLRFLIQQGADVSIQDDFGDTALHHAAIHGAVNCTNDLLKVRADAWAKNLEGLTALDLAERHGHPLIANRFKLMTPPEEE